MHPQAAHNLSGFIDPTRVVNSRIRGCLICRSSFGRLFSINVFFSRFGKAQDIYFTPADFYSSRKCLKWLKRASSFPSISFLEKTASGRGYKMLAKLGEFVIQPVVLLFFINTFPSSIETLPGWVEPRGESQRQPGVEPVSAERLSGLETPLPNYHHHAPRAFARHDKTCSE